MLFNLPSLTIASPFLRFAPTTQWFLAGEVGLCGYVVASYCTTYNEQQAWRLLLTLGEQSRISISMIDLRGIARRLRLSVDQIRIAADLLEQGYQPSFIERYRADETGCLARKTLWAIKLEVDRQRRLQKARDTAKDHLPKDAELDEEATKFLAAATTEVEIEAALRCFRARRTLSQNQEQDEQAAKLLEAMIGYQGAAVPDVTAWTSETLSLDAEAAAETVASTQRLVSSLMQGDTALSEQLRRSIQKKAQIEVEYCEGEADKPADEGKPADSTETPAAASSDQAASAAKASDPDSGDSNSGVEVKPTDAPAVTESSATESGATESNAATEPTAEIAANTDVAAVPADPAPTEDVSADAGDSPVEAPVENTSEAVASGTAETASVEAAAEQPTESTADQPVDQAADATASPANATEATPAVSEAKLEQKPKAKSKNTGKAKSKSNKQKKDIAKLTPRQRRRRWLIGMLQPMKALKCPLTKLTAYQQLMLGRGRRSQLVKTHLRYDARHLVFQSRDAFVAREHPFAAWFEQAVGDALEQNLRTKIEADALSQLEELAQEKLLETAADQLRNSLMRRPIRGHVIMLVDTVGPKASSVAVVGADGEVLATDEIPCSAHADTVNSNVVRLGELAHRYKVTLVALTNGPARRFLVLTVRELMKQSAASGLRWTMADRGGAEAYAAGRVALRELPANNRRDRAAIWIARSLQNPMEELLKVDVNRLRLGSYQRELPQEPLKKLIRETIGDCVSSRGVDTRNASVDVLMSVAGVAEEHAQQINAIAATDVVDTRQSLLDNVTGWEEKDSKQAIGFLRIFGGPQSFDATAIHPDDYRLAERLAENTELNQPPNAPDGWEPPSAKTQLVEPVADESAATAVVESSDAQPAESETTTRDLGETTSEGSDVADSTPIETPEQASPAVESAEASDSTSDKVDSSEDAASDGEQVSVASPEVAATETVTEDNVVAENVGVDSAAVEAPAASEEDATTTVEAPADTTPKVKPEYPEDIQPVATQAPTIDVEKLARGWQVGREKVRWIAHCLHDPFADPRLAGTPVPMLAEMPSLSTLQPEMCVWAVVVGVADFGAFVEIAPDCSGLIHISRLSANFVEDPHQIVQVGDLIMAWVVSIDAKRNRVALTALSPAERAEVEAAERAMGGQRSDNRSRGGNRSGGNRAQGNTTQSGDGQRGGSGQRSGQGQGGRPGGGGRRPGGRDGSRGKGGGRGRNEGGRLHKPIVVTSKKPKAPITDAMKGGEEPLRSFSDLMQFYEAKRTDVPAPKTTEPSVDSSEAGSAEPSPNVVTANAEPKSDDTQEKPAGES